jgi:hypothetical protein
MSLHITAYARATTVETITFKDANGDNVTFESGDIVVVKIGRAGKEPLLQIRSDDDAAGGTSVTNVNPATLVLDEDDLGAETILPGVYDIEALVVDASDSNLLKHAENGIFTLISTQFGYTGPS